MKSEFLSKNKIYYRNKQIKEIFTRFIGIKTICTNSNEVFLLKTSLYKSLETCFSQCLTLIVSRFLLAILKIKSIILSIRLSTGFNF